MGARLPLEELKRLFSDQKVWISVAIVQSTEIAPDRSVVRALVNLLPDETEAVARIGWAFAGAESIIGGLPQPNDLVLVCFADAAEDNEDYAFIFARLTSKEDTFPLTATTGNMVVKALSGKSVRIGSDTKTTIGRGGIVEESEPIPLGNVLVECLDKIATSIDTMLQDISTGPVGIGNLGGSVPIDPTLLVKLQANKLQLQIDIAKYLVTATTNILSQIAFTER